MTSPMPTPICAVIKRCRSPPSQPLVPASLGAQLPEACQATGTLTAAPAPHGAGGGRWPLARRAIVTRLALRAEHQAIKRQRALPTFAAVTMSPAAVCWPPPCCAEAAVRAPPAPSPLQRGFSCHGDVESARSPPQCPAHLLSASALCGGNGIATPEAIAPVRPASAAMPDIPGSCRLNASPVRRRGGVSAAAHGDPASLPNTPCAIGTAAPLPLRSAEDAEVCATPCRLRASAPGAARSYMYLQAPFKGSRSPASLMGGARRFADSSSEDDDSPRTELSRNRLPPGLETIGGPRSPWLPGKENATCDRLAASRINCNLVDRFALVERFDCARLCE